MPRVKITRGVDFSAAHRVYNPDWDDAKNAEIFGECGNVHSHGHNYELFVTVEGEPTPGTGFVMDLRALRDLVIRRVVEDLDHKNLNVDVEWMRGIIPSAENLVVGIWSRLVDQLPDGVVLSKLTLWETRNNYVEYEGH